MSAAFPPYDQTRSHSLHVHQGREGEPGGGYLYLPSAVPSAELCGHFSVKNWAVTCRGRRRPSQARSCPSVITSWIWNWDLPVCPMQRTSALTSICPKTWWAALTWPVGGSGIPHLWVRSTLVSISFDEDTSWETSQWEWFRYICDMRTLNTCLCSLSSPQTLSFASSQCSWSIRKNREYS